MSTGAVLIELLSCTYWLHRIICYAALYWEAGSVGSSPALDTESQCDCRKVI